MRESKSLALSCRLTMLQYRAGTGFEPVTSRTYCVPPLSLLRYACHRAFFTPYPDFDEHRKRRISWKYPQRHDKSAARFEKGGALPKGLLKTMEPLIANMSILIITHKKQTFKDISGHFEKIFPNAVLHSFGALRGCPRAFSRRRPPMSGRRDRRTGSRRTVLRISCAL